MAKHRSHVTPKNGNKSNTAMDRLAPNAGFRNFPVTDAASPGNPKRGKRGPVCNPMTKTSPKTGSTTKGSPKAGRRS